MSDIVRNDPDKNILKYILRAIVASLDLSKKERYFPGVMATMDPRLEEDSSSSGESAWC